MKIIFFLSLLLSLCISEALAESNPGALNIVDRSAEDIESFEDEAASGMYDSSRNSTIGGYTTFSNTNSSLQCYTFYFNTGGDRDFCLEPNKQEKMRVEKGERFSCVAKKESPSDCRRFFIRLNENEVRCPC